MNTKTACIAKVLMGLILVSSLSSATGGPYNIQDGNTVETTAITKDNKKVVVLYEQPVHYAPVSGEFEDIGYVNKAIHKEINFAVYKVIGMRESNNLSNDLSSLEQEITKAARTSLAQYHNVDLENIKLISVEVR